MRKTLFVSSILSLMLLGCPENKLKEFKPSFRPDVRGKATAPELRAKDKEDSPTADTDRWCYSLKDCLYECQNEFCKCDDSCHNSTLAWHHESNCVDGCYGTKGLCKWECRSVCTQDDLGECPNGQEE